MSAKKRIISNSMTFITYCLTMLQKASAMRKHAKAYATRMNNVKMACRSFGMGAAEFGTQWAGQVVAIPWAGHFLSGPGATEEEKNAPKGEMPTFEEIKSKWNEIAPAIRSGLENLPDQALSSVIEIKTPYLSI